MKVKDLCQINPRPKHKYSDWINYIDTSSVNDGGLLDVVMLNGDFPSRAQRELLPNDILISSVRPNLKHNYFVTIDKPRLIGSTGFIQIRADSSRIVPKYLFYYLSSQPRVDMYTAIANLGQTAFPSFNKDVIEELVVPNISIAEQRHIVDAMPIPLRESS